MVVLSWLIGQKVAREFLLQKVFPKVDPRGKAVLITGCDSGFGHMTALELNRLGFVVFAGCLDSKGEGAGRLMQEAVIPFRMKVIQMDVTKDTQVTAAVTTVTQTMEALSQTSPSKKSSASALEEETPTQVYLHAVVNNAGIIEMGEIEWWDSTPGDDQEDKIVSDYRRQLEVNLLGMIRVTRRFLPLIRRNHGRIINLSSIMSKTNVPGINAYCVSKTAAAKFSEGLQNELAGFKHGVTVVDVEPWFYRTPLLRGDVIKSLCEKSWNKTSNQIKDVYGGDKYFTESFLSRMLFMCTDPRNVIQKPEQVVASLVDAVSSGEPDTVYRLISPGFGIAFAIINDFLPWDLLFIARRLTDQLALMVSKK